MAGDTNNFYQRMDIMDILSMISVIAQFNNIEEDKQYKAYIQEFSAKVQKEVDKLHEENDIIMAKLDDIREELSRMEYI